MITDHRQPLATKALDTRLGGAALIVQIDAARNTANMIMTYQSHRWTVDRHMFPVFERVKKSGSERIRQQLRADAEERAQAALDAWTPEEVMEHIAMRLARIEQQDT